MAIPILNHLDLRSVSELQNAILHTTTHTEATNKIGAFIYDTGSSTLKYCTGTSNSDWISLTGTDANTMGSGFVIEDDDGTEVTITENKEVKIIGAGGLTTNWTDTSDGSDSDPYDLTLTIGTLNQDTTGNAATITITDNESTDEENAVLFSANADADGGNLGVEQDHSGMTYNPSSGTLSATALAGTLSTAAQGNVTSLGTLTALTVDDVAIDGKVVTITGSASDTAVLTAGTNGTLSIVTTDAGGASANIQITADGTAELAGTTVTLDSAGGITFDADSGTITFADGGASLGTITSSGYSGQAATVATIAGLAPNTATTQATQGAITSAAALATVGTITSGTWASTTGDIGIAYGGTGQSTAAAAATALLTTSQGGALTIGDGSDTITILGNLTVTGDTIYKNETIRVIANNTLQFEGATADDWETNLTIVDPTVNDKTITLPNLTGHVALLAATTTTTITSTPAELNVLDGIPAGLTAIEIGYVDGVTSAIQTQIDTKSPTTGHASIVTVGAISSGSWVSTDVAVLHGGTGSSNASDARTALGVAYANAEEVRDGTEAAKVVSPDTLAAKTVVSEIDVSDSDFISNLYAEIEHDFETADIVVECYNITTEQTIIADVERKDKGGTASTTKCTIKFSTPPSADVRVIITSGLGATAKTAVYA